MSVRLITSIVACMVLAAPAWGQTDPADVHREVRGPSPMCGLTGDSAMQLMERVRNDSDFAPSEVGGEFTAYSSESHGELRQFTLTTPGNPAHPAVTCRRLYRGAEGEPMMQRLLRCDADRAACDDLFRLLNQSDEAVRASLGG